MAEDLRAIYKRRFEQELEPERYEVFELLEDLTTGRRAFLKAMGGGSLYLLTIRGQGRDLPVRVQISEGGIYRAFTGKMEMGQGSRTLLTQAFAEELRVPPGLVDLVMGDTMLCPDDGGTWASMTTPQTVPVIRKAAAAVRAKQAGESESLTAPGEWKVLGQSVESVNSRAIVTGEKKYPSDLRVEGMLHAAIVRSPHHKSQLISFQAESAERQPGVRVVRAGDLLATVASDQVTARQAALGILAEWKAEPLTPQADWPRMFKQTAVEPVEQPNAKYPPLLRAGDLAQGMAAAVKRKVSTYWVNPIAHVPLEPRAAIAEWKDGSVTIHCGVQAPFLVRQEVARALGLSEANVRIIVSDSGGGFGGKQRGECEVEAALLARAAGAPVRVAWTREEEFTCSYTRPAGLLEVESGVDQNGRLTAMRFANYNSGAAGIAPPYRIPHHWVGFYRTRCDVRQGSYRSLAAVANNFARESHMEEWSQELKIDPLELRLRNIDDARLREVLERTAGRFGWGRKRAGKGRGFGLSCNLEKDARLALFVEIETDGTTVKVIRMTATGDFGAALNPGNLRNQMAGALLQGIGGALWEKVQFDRSAQRTRRLAQYRLPRFGDLPQMDVELIDRREIEPAGAGESPITLPAPALAAAYFSATGERPKSLPLQAAPGDAPRA